MLDFCSYMLAPVVSLSLSLAASCRLLGSDPEGVTRLLLENQLLFPCDYWFEQLILVTVWQLKVTPRRTGR